jgi:predicted polyphosphate/ATP-dependent NAD kinase
MLQKLREQVCIYGFQGAMAGDVATSLMLPFVAVGKAPEQSSASDTQAAAALLREQSVDLLLFVGGDGTARDVQSVIDCDLPALGIPAGVKMQSAVYAVSPEAAGEIIAALVKGELVDIGPAEVLDIDEAAYRQGRIVSAFYGELLVPRLGGFLQHVKNGGVEVEDLVLQDIAADFVESLDDETLYLMGAGTTTRALMEAMGLPHSLLGVDAILGGQLLGSDLSEQKILALLDQHQGKAAIVLTVIGGQGHILGRGNQQFSPEVLRRVGLDNLLLVATKTKLTQLNGRPLLVDSNDPELDRELCGYRKVITGYHDAVMYPVGLTAGE